MAYIVLYGTDMVFQLFRESQRLSHQSAAPLPHGVVEPFDVVGVAFLFACRHMPLLLQNMIAAPEVGEEGGVLAENLRHFLKQRLCVLLPSSPDMEGDDLPVGCVHHQPEPLLVALVAHKAPHLICLTAVELALPPLLSVHRGSPAAGPLMPQNRLPAQQRARCRNILPWWRRLNWRSVFFKASIL